MLNPHPISEEQAAAGLAALGNRTRLRVFKLLVRAGREGLNVGDLQRLTTVPASTMAHHLATLLRAGLIVQERRRREVISTADFDAMTGIASYVTDQCCTGVRLQSDDGGANSSDRGETDAA